MSRYNGFRVRGWTVNFNKFDLQDLSRAIGMPARKLLTWRADRCLTGDWSRQTFNAREVMELVATHRLGDHASTTIADARLLCRAAQHLIWHAIVYENGACESHGTVPDVRDCLRQLKADDAAACDLTALQTGRRYLLTRDSGNEETPSAYFRSDLDGIADGSELTIDLRETAAYVMRRLRRPLLDLDVTYRIHGPQTRRRSRALLPKQL
jgi:hypothetical protein